MATGGTRVFQKSVTYRLLKNMEKFIKTLLFIIEAGKAVKVALTACMHKLIIILNAMAKSGTFWKPIS
jgi:hypothetical protein